MFNVLGPNLSLSCDGSRRRDFLKVGTLGLTGLALPDLLRAQSAFGNSALNAPDKTVIWLFLSGGPTHYETFDPKPGNYHIAVLSEHCEPMSLEPISVDCSLDWQSWPTSTRSFARSPTPLLITPLRLTG